MFYTYAHYTLDTKELFYIGKGKEKRAYLSFNRNRWWHNKVKKHGGFTVEILATWDTEQEALNHEKFLIDCFDGLELQLTNIQKSLGKEKAGKKFSQETRQKMSVSGLKRWNNYSIEEKQIKIEHLNRSNKNKTEQHRLNLSKAKKGKKIPNQWKAVICKTTDIVYPSATEAALKTDSNLSSIIKCCRGKLKKTNGLVFAYV